MQMKELTIDPAELRELAPAGFYVAVRIGFAFPMVELNHLPPSWVREYTAGGLMVHDPAMLWAYKNTGAARWSDLVASDAIGVLDLAKDHGLEFGAVVSCTDRNDPGQRSFGLFCRSDREYAPRELLRLTDRVTEYHRLHSRPSNLTSAELETLGLVKNGLLMKEIACILNVSESAIKQRLKNARLKLNAKTGPQAAALATMFGMI